jgi:prepilin peptidase CpaA
VTSPLLHLALLCSLLVAAAVSDATTRRVPNAIPVSVAALGLVALFSAGGARAALLGAAAAVALMALLAFPWSRHMIGGGDVKLAVACAAWVGLARLHVFVLATAIAGGIVSCAALAAASRGTAEANPAGSATWRERARAIRVPYAIAIGAGALVAIHWRSP